MRGDPRDRAPAWLGGRLYEHGPAGADALVPLLADPSEDIRLIASYALRQFEQLEPRYLPVLIAAHKRGLNVAEAIARTGSAEALRYLEAGWSTDDEARHTNWALPLFGRRAEPFLLRRLERCRQGCPWREAQSLLYALGQIGPIPDSARAVIHDVALSPSTEPELRREMEDQLIYRKDPAALPILVRRLGAVRPGEYEQWQAAHLLEEIYHHGAPAGAAAGPLILHYLSRADLPKARNTAVVTALVVGYRPAIPALRSLLAEADRDWLLAYDTVWALAELGAREARQEIARVARSHWYRPVRNNARRALNMLDGGPFELRERRGTESRGPYAGKLNFAADVEAAKDCRFDRASRTMRFRRDTPVPLRWPQRGAVRIEIERPAERVAAPLGKAPQLPSYGVITLDWPRFGGRIVGVDGGSHWNGGLFDVLASGEVRSVITGNVLALFEGPDGLLVVTGSTAGIPGLGDLWRLRKGRSLSVVDGPLRLPERARGFALTSDRSLLVRTDRGDVAVSRSGRLLRPRPCSADAFGQ